MQFNPLCAKLTEGSNTLKQFSNLLSVFDHFWGIGAKRVKVKRVEALGKSNSTFIIFELVDISLVISCLFPLKSSEYRKFSDDFRLKRD